MWGEERDKFRNKCGEECGKECGEESEEDAIAKVRSKAGINYCSCVRLTHNCVWDKYFYIIKYRKFKFYKC